MWIPSIRFLVRMWSNHRMAFGMASVLVMAVAAKAAAAPPALAKTTGPMGTPML